MAEQSKAALGRQLGPLISIASALYVGTAVFFCLPVLMTALGTHLGFDESQQGMLAMMEMSGIGLASLPATWWVTRVRWRLAARSSQLILILTNLACIGVTSFEDFERLFEYGLAPLVEHQVAVVLGHGALEQLVPQRYFDAVASAMNSRNPSSVTDNTMSTSYVAGGIPQTGTASPPMSA